MGSYAKPMEGQVLLSFLSGGGGKKLFVILQCIFGHATTVSGIENYPSVCMSCCSDDLALLLSCLDLWSLGYENVSVQEYIFTSIQLQLQITVIENCGYYIWFFNYYIPGCVQGRERWSHTLLGLPPRRYKHAVGWQMWLRYRHRYQTFCRRNIMSHQRQRTASSRSP